MSITLAHNNYGKSGIRLVKVARRTDRHDLKQLTVGIQFEGDFESCYVYGDNTRILPTDTMKNTVYAFAKLYEIEQIEEFARHLAEHFLTDNDQISKVRIDIAEDLWARIPHGGKPHGTTFMPAGLEQRTTAVTATRDAMTIAAGIDNLLLLKTAGSGFENYIHDPFTTLAETAERILATAVKVSWTYKDNEIPFNAYWNGVREALLQTFVEHDSKSVQHTLYAMANAALERYEDITEISVSMPNKHCLLVDLSRFGLDNNNEVFMPVDEPYGLIEARVKREQKKSAAQ
jgi:urate oxidase